jgi:hypothetical protein
MSKRVQLSEDDILGRFYEALLSSNPTALKELHIPRSDVFYVRNAIHNSTGVKYTLDHVERAMYLEGHLSRNDVLDPDRKREYG